MEWSKRVTMGAMSFFLCFSVFSWIRIFEIKNTTKKSLFTAKELIGHQALVKYFDKKGCINPSASNYDPKALINTACTFN